MGAACAQLLAQTIQLIAEFKLQKWSLCKDRVDRHVYIHERLENEHALYAKQYIQSRPANGVAESGLIIHRCNLR